VNPVFERDRTEARKTLCRSNLGQDQSGSSFPGPLVPSVDYALADGQATNLIFRILAADCAAGRTLLSRTFPLDDCHGEDRATGPTS
jgi:hypothetical protein